MVHKEGKISVIIPTKDEAENMMPLALALQKALQQFDFDVIIIDAFSYSSLIILKNRFASFFSIGV